MIATIIRFTVRVIFLTIVLNVALWAGMKIWNGATRIVRLFTK